MKPKISVIYFGVADVEASVAFYKQLGFQPRNYTEGDDHVFFALEGTWLGLYPKDKLAGDVGISVEGSGFPGITVAHNEPSKEDVDRVIEEARSLGAEIVKEPQDVSWGGYSSYFRDPDGYLWEIAWNPFTDLT